MLRYKVVPLLLLLLLAVAIEPRAAPTTEEPVEESTYMAMQEGTITVDVDSDVILTTSPEGEIFTEASPLELTEEPLPDSVIQQLERERAQEERARHPEVTEAETEAETETEPPTITEQPATNTTTKSTRTFKFGATTMPPGITTTTTLSAFSTQKPEITTTDNSKMEDTTQELTTVKNYFGRLAANTESGDLEMAENRMETTTNGAVQEQNLDFISTPAAVEISMMMATEATLVEEKVPFHGETDVAESVLTTLSPLFRFFSTSPAVPVATEAQPEPTTVVPAAKEDESTIVPVLEERTEITLPSSTQAPESITEAAETTIAAVPSTTAATEPEPLTVRMELYLHAQPESTSTTSVPETTTSTTSAPETTTLTTTAPETTTSTTTAPETTIPFYSIPETTTSTTSAPETTTSTTSAPETTTSTTSAPETTTSTTSAPETTTSTTKAPETTTSTSSAPETTTSTTEAPTTTTTTARPIQTREPRVERIFNSDGVEVLYGYSSVVRTNRS